MIFLLLAVAQWVPVSHNPWQYFRYWGENGSPKAIEHSSEHPKVYRFWGPPAPQRTVCAIENRPGVYWFTPSGHALNHTFPTPNPGEFNVIALQKRIHGFSVTAAFAGKAERPGAVETVYFTDRACSDGGVEFGFARDLSTNSILVYWSTFTNCANDSASLCRKTDDGSLGANFSNVQQENSGTDVDHGFRIYGLDVNQKYTFTITADQSAFHIGVDRGQGKIARCAESESSTLAPCTFVKRVQSWFPIATLNSGYLVAGTQTAGDPGIAPSSEFRVSDILVAQPGAK